MDELTSSVLNRHLAAIEKAMAQAYHADPLLYVELFKLHQRLQRQVVQLDADFSSTQAGGERGVARERLVIRS